MARFSITSEGRLAGPRRLARAWLRRLVDLQAVERSVALGSYAFTALIPLLTVYGAVANKLGAAGFADRLSRRFQLKGSAAASLHQAFAPPGAVAAVLAVARGAIGWTVTPYLLLGRRLRWHLLLPGGVVTAVAMSALAAGSIVYLPRSVGSSAAQYGLIGVAFALCARRASGVKPRVGAIQSREAGQGR